MDVTSEESVKQGAQYVKQKAPDGLWAIINNAGKI